MGIYRYLLSLTVVLFHLGGLAPLSGRIAVFGFYCVSGYLMALVLERVYLAQKGGIPRFYLNRFLRLYPLFAFYVMLTAGLRIWYGSEPFLIEQGSTDTNGVITFNLLKYNTEQWIKTFTFERDYALHPPAIWGGGGVLPQSWSLVVEGFFYLCAPFLVLLYRQLPAAFYGLGLLSLGYALGLGWYDYKFEDWVYKNYLPTAWMFMLGVTVYFHREVFARRITDKTLVLSLVILLYASLVFFFEREKFEFMVYPTVVLLAFGVAVASQIRDWPPRWQRVDKVLGDLAYGVFLCHFVVGFLMMLVTVEVREAGGPFNIFGRFNKIEFGLYASVFSTVMACATYHLVEKPVESLRTRVRHKRGYGEELPAATPAAAPAPESAPERELAPTPS